MSMNLHVPSRRALSVPATARTRTRARVRAASPMAFLTRGARRPRERARTTHASATARRPGGARTKSPTVCVMSAM